jgi:hypothetical protein
MTPEPISTTCFINPSYQSCVSERVFLLSLQSNGSVKYIPLSVLGNGWVKTFPQQGIHAKIEESLDAPFFMRSCLIKGELVGLCILLSLLGKNWVDVRAVTKNCWRRRFLCGSCLIKREFVGLYIRLSLLGKNSVKTFARQRRIVGGVVFCAVRVMSKECIRLSLLGSKSVKTFARQRRNVGGVVFYAVRVLSKGSPWVCLCIPHRC